MVLLPFIKMVLKIQRPNDQSNEFAPPPPPQAAGESRSFRDSSVDPRNPVAQSRGAVPSLPPLPPPNHPHHHHAVRASRSRDSGDVSRPRDGARASRGKFQCCDGCGISDEHAPGSLLLFDDPEEDVNHYAPKRPEDEKRYVSNFLPLYTYALCPMRNISLDPPSHYNEV